MKVLELLLFLSVLPVPPVELEQRCFTNSQVTLAKEVCQYLTDHMDSKITIQELSGQFNASATLIKSSFRGVYGMSPSAFLRAQKMHSAATIMPVNLPRHFGTSSGSPPTSTAAAWSRTAVRRCHPRLEIFRHLVVDDKK